jgi:hypothetical protein
MVRDTPTVIRGTPTMIRDPPTMIRDTPTMVRDLKSRTIMGGRTVMGVWQHLVEVVTRQQRPTGEYRPPKKQAYECGKK